MANITSSSKSTEDHIPLLLFNIAVPGKMVNIHNKHVVSLYILLIFSKPMIILVSSKGSKMEYAYVTILGI